MQRILFVLMVCGGLLAFSGCGGAADANEPSQAEIQADSIAQEVESIAAELEKETDSLKNATESTLKDVEQLLEGI